VYNVFFLETLCLHDVIRLITYIDVLVFCILVTSRLSKALMGSLTYKLKYSGSKFNFPPPPVSDNLNIPLSLAVNFFSIAFIKMIVTPFDAFQ